MGTSYWYSTVWNTTNIFYMVLKKHNWFIHPDTDESDKDKKMVFEEEDDIAVVVSEETSWYHIKATDSKMDRIVTFWLWGDSESDIKNKVLTKGYYKDIEWIEKDIPPFI